MPAHDKKRIKPVIEEVVEETPETPPVEIKEEKPEPEAPEVTPKKEQTANKINLKLIVVITLVSALVAAFVSGGVYVYLSGLESLKDEPENEIMLEPAASPTASPTSSPEPTDEDLSGYTVQVLNGSGAIGAAGSGEDVLVEAGFNVAGTGNAANYNFEKTVVAAKSSVPAEVVSQIKKALEESEYEIEVGDVLSASSKFDIVVTIGAN